MVFSILLQQMEIAFHTNSYIEELMQRIGSGDKGALELLYYDTRAAIYSFSLSLTKSTSDAEDILQETYLKIWANAGRYKANGTPMAWILTIAKNLSLMRLRERKRHQDLEPEEWDMMFHIPDTAENTQDRHLLEAALCILSEEERNVILLHAVAGLKHREIAQLQDMALATVLSKYHRGLKKLRQYIEGGKE